MQATFNYCSAMTENSTIPQVPSECHHLSFFLSTVPYLSILVWVCTCAVYMRIRENVGGPTAFSFNWFALVPNILSLAFPRRSPHAQFHSLEKLWCCVRTANGAQTVLEVEENKAITTHSPPPSPDQICAWPSLHPDPRPILKFYFDKVELG